MSDCEPVADAQVVVENSAGQKVEARTDRDGRFTLTLISIDGAEGDSMSVSGPGHSELQVTGVGGEDVLGPGQTPVLVRLPRGASPPTPDD
jgi:hypothetical protein